MGRWDHLNHARQIQHLLTSGIEGSLAEEPQLSAYSASRVHNTNQPVSTTVSS
jgi:hypothetical protein